MTNPETPTKIYACVCREEGAKKLANPVTLHVDLLLDCDTPAPTVEALSKRFDAEWLAARSWGNGVKVAIDTFLRSTYATIIKEGLITNSVDIDAEIQTRFEAWDPTIQRAASVSSLIKLKKTASSADKAKLAVMLTIVSDAIAALEDPDNPEEGTFEDDQDDDESVA